MTAYYKRGDVIFADFDPAIGSEQAGRRPALVIQNDIGNKYSNTIIVAMITKSHKKGLPTHILVDEDFLESDSVLLLEQIRTIDISRISKYMGSVEPETMIDIDNALAISVGIKPLKRKGLIMTLCHSCVQAFYDSPYHNVKRSDSLQVEKESCTFCGAKNGFDYVIVPVKELKTL